MKRENLRQQLSKLLMDTNEDNPLKCNILIGEDESFGLSTLQITTIIELFQEPKEGIIWFKIEGYSPLIEFDNLSIEDIENIYNNLL